MEKLRVLRAALFASALLVSCASRPSETHAFVSSLGTTSIAPRTTSDGRVVLVTIDGARWQDVFEGSDPQRSAHVPPEELMPRVHAMLKNRGVAFGADKDGCGIVHTAGGANVSLPGYQEIFTGRPSSCLDNGCAGVTDSVMDEAWRSKVAGVASIGSWSVLDRAVSNGSTGVFVAEGPEWPADAPSSPKLDELARAGERSDPYPGVDDYRPDVYTAAIALEYYREFKPAFFHVGLGDADEWGHRDDYGAYLMALRQSDALIGDLMDVIDSMGADGAKTTLIVTPDHGRNSDFRHHSALRIESGRTFLLAFGAGVTARGIGCPSSDITLTDIAPTIRLLLGLPRDISDGAGRPVDLRGPTWQ